MPPAVLTLAAISFLLSVTLVSALDPIFPKKCGYCPNRRCLPKLGLTARIIGGFEVQKAGEIPWQAFIQ